MRLGLGLALGAGVAGDPVSAAIASNAVSVYGRWGFSADKITLASGKISQANDLGPNNYHVTQGTAANRPTPIASGKNGRDVAQFINGTSNVSLSKTSGLALAAGNAFSVAFVWKVDTGPDATRYISPWLSTNSLGQSGVNVELYDTTNTRRVRWKNGAGADVGITTFGTMALGTWELWVVRVSAASNGGAATQASYRVNGAAQSPTGTPAVWECQAGTRNIILGNRTVTAGTYDETIAEIIAADVYWSDAQVTALETSLNQKWAVY